MLADTLGALFFEVDAPQTTQHPRPVTSVA